MECFLVLKLISSRFVALSYLIFCFAVLTNPLNSIGHSFHGADYGTEGSSAYSASPSSFDRDKFLNPYFLPFLKNLEGQILLDAGCGPAHFAIMAAREGAKVYGIDINENMIISGLKCTLEANLVSKVSLDVGTVSWLPYRSAMFDRILSINVACNISSGAVLMHFQEMSRVLKKDGLAILTVPISLDIVFTHEVKNQKDVLAHIDQVLEQLPDNPVPSQIYSHLMKLQEVVNATFIIKKERLALVTDLSQLKPGQEIWRKLPVLVVPNYYHSEREYTSALAATDLKIEKVEKPHFINPKDRLAYNRDSNSKTSFGPAYEKHAPYAIFYLRKS